MKCDAVTADRVGATWLRAAIAPVGDFGRRAEAAAQPFGPGDEASATARCAQIVTLAHAFAADGVATVQAALRRAPDPLDIVSRATVGDPLADVDFFELGRFADALDATARAWDAAGGPRSQRPPVLPEIIALLARGRAKGTFYLADAFAAPLAVARAAYIAADADAAAERARLAAAFEPVLGPAAGGEEFIVMRDVVPHLPAGLRIVRETPAYRVVALEFDGPALAATARRDSALADVAVQEEAVRRDLAVEVARRGDALVAATAALGELDRTLARVAFARDWGGCVPAFSTAAFAFSDASFVPLRAALRDAGLPYTPISLDLRGAAVLTGPNMGGKSAALATCGFLAACVAAGVPPPATQATLPLSGTLAWVGGEPSADRARLLSAFGSEVVRAREQLADADRPALFLIDEFARTTGPREGRALLVALVEALAARGDFALVATHFDGVARAAQVAHLTIAGLSGRRLDAHAAGDIHAALDAVARAMDYRIVAGDAAAHVHSDALALAGLLGLDSAIVERASILYANAADGAHANALE